MTIDFQNAFFVSNNNRLTYLSTSLKENVDMIVEILCMFLSIYGLQYKKNI